MLTKLRRPPGIFVSSCETLQPALATTGGALYPPAMTIQPSDSILIVDFGSQVTQLIARRVREAGVYSEIAPFNSAAEAFTRMAPKGIILSPGLQSLASRLLSDQLP